MKKSKKILSLILTAIMVFCIIPLTKIEVEAIGNRDWKWPVPSTNSLSACYLDGRDHYALDIWTSGRYGDNIYASYSGTVIDANTSCSHNYAKNSTCCGGGLGKYVFIRHTYNGTNYVSRYGHMSSVNVSVGDIVNKNTVIGTVGCTGYSFGPHLDFRIYRGSTTSHVASRDCVDPFKEQFLEKPTDLNAKGATTQCCKNYVNEVNSIYNTPADTQAPTISNVKISNVTSAGYTVTCTVKDNVGVTRVAFPTWTHANGQDDLIWKDGTINGNTATFTVKSSDHNNESGYYATHIYAYDAAGNDVSYGIDVNVPGTHTHSYTSTITRNPTCKTDGIRTYRCSCGASYTENIGKHAATHEGGTEIRNARAATCKDTGYTGDTYCKGCGVCLGYGTSTAKNKNNHTGGTTIKNTKNPTCTVEGYTGDTYCKGCDTKLSSGKAIAKIAHDYEEIARIYPDCIKTGLITYACYCGASYDEVIPANGHTETAWIIHKAATCTAAGTKYKECTVCEELLDIEIIPVAPHDYDIVVTEETCTTDGYSTYTCPDCGDVYVGDKVPATGHTESEWIIDLEATCTEKGSKHIECTVCGETLKTESIAKTPHDYNYVVTDATCETDGYTTVTCPDCGDTYITDEVPAFGHNDENKDTLCDACGLQLTCEHCGRPVHEGQTNEYLCIIIMTIKLLMNFLNMVTK